MWKSWMSQDLDKEGMDSKGYMSMGQTHNCPTLCICEIINTCHLLPWKLMPQELIEYSFKATLAQVSMATHSIKSSEKKEKEDIHVLL